jgi:hypothetical protein
MEVHHHPDLHHKKKNFKEYFLEFLMIFLAVTLGFFAENIREYISSRDKENIDIRSLSRNLTEDSAMIAYQIQSNEKGTETIDSMMELIRSGRYKDEPEMLYRFAYTTRGFQNFQYSNITFEEMKSSGSFGFIRKINIRNNLVNYNNFITGLRGLESRMLETEKNQANLQSEILDDGFYPSVDSIIYKHALRSHFYKNKNKSVFLTQDKQAQFSKLYNLLFERNVIFQYYQLNMKKLKDLNGQLLVTIYREYHLKTE